MEFHLENLVRTLYYFLSFLQLTTTVSAGAKEKVAVGASSNTGLIAGLCLGILAIIICALVLLYLRYKKPRYELYFIYVSCRDI